MEKLATKRNISLLGIISILIVLASYFVIQNSNKEDEKLFDIFLADLYNEENTNIDEKLYYLSSLDKPNVSFYDSFDINGLLVMFICNHCPYVRSIENKISGETQRLKDINVNSIAFMSNDQSAYEEDHDQFLLKQISRAKFKFDYIVDLSLIHI